VTEIKMKRKTIVGLIALAAVIAVAMLAGCVDSKSNKLEILDYKDGYTDYNLRCIKGTAKNVGSSTLRYAEIRVKFYDKEGTLLDTSIDNINDLGPGETWRFEVVHLGRGKWSKYKISVGSVY
jgi:hypothetical protein